MVAADEGKALKVRVAFSDDAGNAESLTSAATAAVTQPLTAAIHDAPESHDGQSVFTFELRFNEAPKTSFSYATLEDHAFTVAGGQVTEARRLEPNKNVRWEISVRPSGNAAATVSLLVTTDCASQGAICTEDGRMLSAEVELVIPGPSSQQSSQENSAATGAPTITGTARVGEILTAATTDISDSDGITNADFAYQWLADDTAIESATASTYTVVAEDEGKALTVRVAFSDDAGNAESLTSAATAAVAARTPLTEPVAPDPLTASFSQAPESHDGQSVFTFELRFSEELKTSFSYITLRDNAFPVTGGEVVKARRLRPGSNIGWEISVRPDSSADVTIVLPITTDCSAQGAVCTEDGRMLSGRLELTVSGPSG